MSLSRCQDAQVDPVQVPHMETQLDFDRELDRTENGCCSNAPDPVTQKLTRAQRKRIKKRKLKEAASTRRKTIGPLPPPGYQKINLAHQMETFQNETLKSCAE